MKVSDVMQTSIVTVSEDTPLREVERLIFSLGIAGVPVVKAKKLIGIVTEQDILSRLYPTVQDIIEDYTHARNFDEMENNVSKLFYTPVKEIMNKRVTTVSPSTPLMKAHSLMLTRQFSRLPIVDENKNLIGIISQGDIFRHILKSQIPHLEQERYAGFIAQQYDLMVNWERRFEFEYPALYRLFSKEKAYKILDIGVWTGEYTVRLAKKGDFTICGLDHNKIMIEIAEKKKQKLPRKIRDRVSFLLTDFTDFAGQLSDPYDAVICMGNALPYLPIDQKNLFKQANKVLRNQNGIIILQIINFEKILKKQDRLLSFKIEKSKERGTEHLFLEFFDHGKGGPLLHHLVVFESTGANWMYKGITSVPVYDVRKDDLEKNLHAAGFTDVSFSGNRGDYQGDYGQLSLSKPFDVDESDWLNVIAKR